MHYINHVMLVAGWALIRVNFYPMQEIEPKVRSGCSFKGGHSFARLWYMPNSHQIFYLPMITVADPEK